MQYASLAWGDGRLCCGGFRVKCTSCRGFSGRG